VARADHALEDARLLAEHHIAGVRYTRKGRRISHVLHPQLGWLTIADYYKLQKTHELEPWIAKTIEGGYRMKAAIWGTQVGAATVNVPAGAIVLAGALALVAADRDNPALQALDLLSLALPFGELYLVYRGVNIFAGAIADVEDLFRPLPSVGKTKCENLEDELARTKAALAINEWNPLIPEQLKQALRDTVATIEARIVAECR